MISGVKLNWSSRRIGNIPVAPTLMVMMILLAMINRTMMVILGLSWARILKRQSAI